MTGEAYPQDCFACGRSKNPGKNTIIKDPKGFFWILLFRRTMEFHKLTIRSYPGEKPLGSKTTNNENVVELILRKCYAGFGGKLAA
jgi:hypothetical protein